MDAQTKLKLALGELMLQQIQLASQVEALTEENKKLKEQLSKDKENGADNSN